MVKNQYDCIVVGAGFAGISAARLLAEHNKKVLIIDERYHIGGNSYDEVNDNGVLIHPYGPHIFHTKEKRVFDFVSKFSPFVKYEHRVKGNIDGKIVPIPFNFASIEKCFDKTEANKLKELLVKQFGSNKSVSIYDLLNASDNKLKELGGYVYEKVFAKYTAKQWGIDISQVDKSVINRVPVVIGYGDTYFNDEYQCMPKNGFTALFNEMLKHPNITLKLETPAESILSIKDKQLYFRNEKYQGIVVFTGRLDKLFNYKYGPLPYRSIKFRFEDKNCDSYQEAAVINYNTSEEFTRITEFKKLTGQMLKDRTTILKEFPTDFINDGNLVPCYPIKNDRNDETYKKYLFEANSIKGFYCCGRLAEYKYYNMDKTISRAMDVVDEILK